MFYLNVIHEQMKLEIHFLGTYHWQCPWIQHSLQ